MKHNIFLKNDKTVAFMCVRVHACVCVRMGARYVQVAHRAQIYVQYVSKYVI